MSEIGEGVCVLASGEGRCPLTMEAGFSVPKSVEREGLSVEVREGSLVVLKEPCRKSLEEPPPFPPLGPDERGLLLPPARKPLPPEPRACLFPPPPLNLLPGLGRFLWKLFSIMPRKGTSLCFMTCRTPLRPPMK